MSYHLEGRLLEVCNCNVLCPCWIGEDPDNGTCDTIIAWRVDKGTVDGVSVGGNTIAAVAHVPGNILEGNWTAAIFVDENASEEQEKALLKVYTGQAGGPVAELAKLIGNVVSVERAPIKFTVNEGKGELAIGKDYYALLEPYRNATGALDHPLRHRVLDGAGRAGVCWQGAELPVEATTPSASTSTSRTTTRCKAHSSSTHERDGRRAGPVAPPAIAACFFRCWPRWWRWLGPRLWAWTRSPYGRYLEHDDWTASGPAAFLCRVVPGGDIVVPAALYAGAWILMTVAMMLPTTLPLFNAFDRVTTGRADHGRLLVLLGAGYLAVWGGFGLLAHALHSGLLSTLARWPVVAWNGWVIGAAVIALAGAFQFSSLKYKCLEKCRTPLSFVIAALARHCAVPGCLHAGRAPWLVLRGLLLGADAADVRVRRGQHRLDARPRSRDGDRKERALGPAAEYAAGGGAAGVGGHPRGRPCLSCSAMGWPGKRRGHAAPILVV